MSPVRDITHGLYAALRLAQFRKDGMQMFDISVGGFWRSFLALPISVALHVASLMLPAMMEPAQRTAAVLATAGIAKLFTLLLPILAMLLIAKLINRSPRFSVFVIVFNWCGALLAALVFVAAILASLIVGSGFEEVPIIFALIYSLAFTWYQLRESFEADILLTFLLLLVVILVQELVDYGVSAAIGFLAA